MGRDGGAMRRTYLDHNATTPLHPAARDAMAAAFDIYGNPSSTHAEGRRARVLLDEARRAVGTLTGATPENVIFTSGATEALNIVLRPELALDGRGFDRLLVSAGEHPAVRAGHRFGDKAQTLPLLPDGTLDLAALDAALDRLAGASVMLALQAANNETGVIQPVAEAAERVHARGGYVVCDAVQAVGKIPCDLASLGADALAISAHKFGGPKGVGALCFAPTRHHLKEGAIRGGGQERGLSAGTENVVGIAGMAAACGIALGTRGEAAAIAARRDRLEDEVRGIAPDAVVFGSTAPRLPNTSCFAVPGLETRTVLMNLDLAGFAVSGGSACASGKTKPSHVLEAMGVDAGTSAAALRVSLCGTTSEDEVAGFVEAFGAIVRRMRARVAA